MIMNRLVSIGQLIVIGSMLLMVGLSFVIKSCTADTRIHASVSPLYVEVGSPIRYCDSTYKATDVLWQFGNDDSSYEKTGTYTYDKPGTYQVTLTVNKDKKQNFLVNVKDSRQKKDKQMVHIIAPKKVKVGESVVFTADGDSDNWSWEFGETGRVDSEEQNPTYVYSRLGSYEVKLLASNMKYPISHKIEVESRFVIIDDIDRKNKEDFQIKLQAIIDKKNFNVNYNYLLKKYLRGNPKTIVLINGTNENDFYSYCQGLLIKGKQESTVITEVNLERDANKKIKRVLVNQVSSN